MQTAMNAKVTQVHLLLKKSCISLVCTIEVWQNFTRQIEINCKANGSPVQSLGSNTNFCLHKLSQLCAACPENLTKWI